MRRRHALRRAARRALPILAVFALVAVVTLHALLPLDSPVRSAVRFNAARLGVYLRGTGPGRDAWLARTPAQYPLSDDLSADVAVVIKTGYATRHRVPALLEALGLVRKEEVVITIPPPRPSPFSPRWREKDGDGPDVNRTRNEPQGQAWRREWTGREPTRRVKTTRLVRAEDGFVLVSDFGGATGSGGGGGGGGDGFGRDAAAAALESVGLCDAWAALMDRISPRLVNSPRLIEYKSMLTAIEDGYSELAGNMARYYGWGLETSKFLIGLETAYAQDPSRKWYVVIDDDTALSRTSLRRLLERLNPAAPWYIGNPVGDFKGRFAHTSAAAIFSAEAVRRLVSSPDVLAQAHLRSLSDHGGEKLLAVTLQRLGVYLDEGHAHLFDPYPPRVARIDADNFCAPLVSIHGFAEGVDPAEMNRLGTALRSSSSSSSSSSRSSHVDHDDDMPGGGGGGGSSSSSSSDRDSTFRWADLWRLYGQPALEGLAPGAASQNRDHVGPRDRSLTSEFRSVASSEACWLRCRRQGRRCLAWTWEQPTQLCFTAPWFVVGGEIMEGSTSGVNSDRIRELNSHCA